MFDGKIKLALCNIDKPEVLFVEVIIVALSTSDVLEEFTLSLCRVEVLSC